MSVSLQMSRTFETDYAVGTQSEDALLAVFRQEIPDLQKIKNPYALFDYEGSTTYVELKTRTFAKDKYPTTMIGLNKVKAAERTPHKTYYFAFKFTDGLYWIKYDKDLFATFEIKRGGRYDRGRPETAEYCYIPIEHLCPIQPEPFSRSALQSTPF